MPIPNTKNNLIHIINVFTETKTKIFIKVHIKIPLSLIGTFEPPPFVSNHYMKYSEAITKKLQLSKGMNIIYSTC